MSHDPFDEQPWPDEPNAPSMLPAPQPDTAWGDYAAPPHEQPGPSDCAPARHPWRAELTRWLLTLNPGRTQT